MKATLPLKHLLLAIAVVAVWGSNFVVIKLGLAQLPPLLFATLRFLFAALPAALFLRRPAVPLREVAAYGVLIGAGQFGLLFLAMRRDISPGLASLVVQLQVFFTIGFVMALERRPGQATQRLQPYQFGALALALAGIAVIALHTDATTTLTGLAMVLGAALSWAAGNVISRRAVGVNMLAYVVWASLFSVPPLALLSWVFEGSDAMVHGLRGADAGVWGAVLWQSVGNTLFGYTAWTWLLSRHPAAVVAPMALLVPVFGIASSALWLGEPLPAWKLGAAALVIGGLALNLFWPRWRAALAWKRAPS